MSKIPIVVVLLAVVAGGSYLVWGGADGRDHALGTSSDDSETNNGNGASSTANTKKQPVSKKVAAPSAGQLIREEPVPPTMGPGPKSLSMPDGTYLPVLNGAVGAPAVVWPDGQTYSPVIKKVIDKFGLEWYQHKDGSYTTTQNEYRADLGRTEPATTIYNPRTPTIIVPGEGEKAMRDAQKNKGSSSGGVQKD